MNPYAKGVFAILWVIFVIIAGLVWKDPSPAVPETLVTGRVEKVEYVEHWNGNYCHVSVTTDERVLLITFYNVAAKAAQTLLAKGDRIRFSSKAIGKGSGPHKFGNMDWFDKIPETVPSGGKP